MERTLRTLAVVAIVGLLAAILAFVISIGKNGIHISYSGEVRMIGIPDEIELRLAEPVVLTMPDGTTLTATVSGAQSAPVALAFSDILCQECGSSMLPVRFNVLTGKIDWACPQCGATGP